MCQRSLITTDKLNLACLQTCMNTPDVFHILGLNKLRQVVFAVELVETGGVENANLSRQI